MPVDSPSNEYLFLMRGADWDKGISPTEAQDGIVAMMAWIDELKAQGLIQSGQPLDFAGGIAKFENGVVTDGPYIESKEAVGGYLVVNAKNFKEAMTAAKECPALKYGLMIEVRPILGNCHIAEEFGLDMAASTS